MQRHLRGDRTVAPKFRVSFGNTLGSVSSAAIQKMGQDSGGVGAKVRRGDRFY